MTDREAIRALAEAVARLTSIVEISLSPDYDWNGDLELAEINKAIKAVAQGLAGE